MKRTYISLIALWWVILATAQVTTSPNPIPKSYTGQVIITFDPKGGNGGMVGATQCYAHTGIITSESTGNSDWKNVVSDWRASNTPQLTATSDGKWQLVMDNMFAFYDVPETTEIIALAMVFHDGPKGSQEGKTSSGGDIIISLGESVQTDIWDNFTPEDTQVQTRPEGVVNGIYYGADGTSVTLCTYAASKTAPAQHVFLLGDMTDWKLDNAYQLKRDGNYFWITLNGLEKGKEYRYQYAVIRDDGVKKQISDLFSEKVIHPDDKYEPKSADPTLIDYPTLGADGGYVTVIQTGKKAYNWSDATLNFVRPNKNNLIIYELWVYDYTTLRNYAGLLERLDYLQNLGVNAIELMPVNEFDGNYSWGYSPNHYFALDKAYGTPEQFKQLVDECHKRGIAVIMDMSFDHATSLNPMNKLYPYGTDLESNPWFNVTAPHADGVYEDWNHGFTPTRDHFTRVLQYWLTEYKIDGYRMELSHGLCSDAQNTSVENLQYYYINGVQAVAQDAYFICEHWGVNMSSEQAQLVSSGMLCWTNTNNAYCQTAMGWLIDDGFGNASRDGYVSYCESHDEERTQYKAMTYGNGTIGEDEYTRLKRVPLNVAFNVLLDGSHMLWQYEELGYDYSIYSDIDNPNGYNETWRTNIKPRPETLGYFTDSNRINAYTKCAQIIQLRTRLLPSVFESSPTTSSLSSGQEIRSVLWGSDVYAVGNFSASSDNSVSLPSGTWYDYLSGGTAAATTYTIKSGEIKIFTGTPLSAPVITTDFTSFADTTATTQPVDTSTTTDYKQLWPVLMDDMTYNTYRQHVVSDLRADNKNVSLFIWPSGETYAAGDGVGMNFFNNTGGYVSLVVANQGWSGCGYAVESEESQQAAQQLKEKIIANPENYFLHIAIKSKTAPYHQFYIFGDNTISFILGSNEVVDGYDGEKGAAIPLGEFERDGKWHDFYIPMKPFAQLMASSQANGNTLLAALSGGVQGTELDLDAIYFCNEAMKNSITPSADITVITERQTITLNFSDIESIDDWTITNATLNETETTMYDYLETYVYDIYSNIPGVAYVTDMPDITFTMESTSDKTKAFYVGINRGYYGFYQTGGKNGIITIKDTQPYDIITLEVASKGSTAANFADSKGQYPINAVAITQDLVIPAKNSGAEGEDNSGYTYRTLVYHSTGGDVQIKECAAGFRLRYISIEPGEAPMVTVLGQQIPTDTTGVIDIYGDSTLIYDTEENTLTLNNLNLEVGEDESAAISYSGMEPLTIVLNDSSTIVADTVIYSAADIVITGDGHLAAEGVTPITGVPTANITFEAVNMYVRSLPSAAAVRRRIKGGKRLDETGGPALSGFGSADFNKTNVSPSDAEYGPVSTTDSNGNQTTTNALYTTNANGEQEVITEFELTANTTAVESIRTAQPFDPSQPMYNILGLPVDAAYKGLVIQNGQTFILK